MIFVTGRARSPTSLRSTWKPTASRYTKPASPCAHETVTVAPDATAVVASPVPTTAGIPSSLAMMAAWHVRPPRLVTIAAAVALAGVAGIVFSLLGIAIRHCVTGTTSHSAVVVIITATGVLTLGPLSFYSAGAAKLMATPWPQYALMFRAGVCNLVAFLALVRGLQLTTALHVNMINAGQVAIAAGVGVRYFNESCNRWLVLGVGLMIVGILAFGSPVDREAVDAHV